MAEIGVHDGAGPPAFTVRYAVESGPRPPEHLPEFARLRLAFRFTPGAAFGPSRQVGEFYYGQPDGAIDYYECPVEPSPANVTALLATDFPWTPAAAGLAASYRTDPAAVARVRADVDATHRENVERVRRYMERVRAGDMSAEALRELREASEGLDG